MSAVIRILALLIGAVVVAYLAFLAIAVVFLQHV